MIVFKGAWVSVQGVSKVSGWLPDLKGVWCVGADAA